MRIILIVFGFLAAVGCTKTFSVAKPKNLPAYRATFSASPNDLYYALRWALTANDYPIAVEDFQNGVITSRYVAVSASSHYLDVFGRRDFGVTNSYHQLEVRLTPKGEKTIVTLHSRIQGVAQPLRSTGEEEKKILAKIGDYLRKNTVQITNLGAVKGF